MQNFLLNWKLMSSIWIFLNFLLISILFLIRILYRNLPGFMMTPFNKKKFFSLFPLWIGYVVLFVIYGEIDGVLSHRYTINHSFIHIGIYYFFVIGWIVYSLTGVGMYLIWKRNLKEAPNYPKKISKISEFYNFLEYALIVFVCFLITKHYFLLGGSIGVLLRGLISLYLYYQNDFKTRQYCQQKN